LRTNSIKILLGKFNALFVDPMSETKPLFQYRPLGNTGVKVSELCFGAMTVTKGGKGGRFNLFGTYRLISPAFGTPASNEEESVKLLNTFVEQGGNFIDTADMYYESEEVLGR